MNVFDDANLPPSGFGPAAPPRFRFSAGFDVVVRRRLLAAGLADGRTGVSGNVWVVDGVKGSGVPFTVDEWKDDPRPTEAAVPSRM